jgi:prolyl-tRNA editing enzyme YbaK/EbsC (Cys-tRNA(Pro) deacylase)
MTAHLSPSAQRVQDTLRRLGYPFSVLESDTHTRTAQQAADLVGCDLGQIVKSLIFKGGQTGKPILVLTSGVNRADEALVSRYAGEPIGRADPDFVREVTGYAIGGVPPVGHNQPIETYLDQDLLQYQSLWAAGGTPNSLFELTPAALQEMTGGKVAAVRVGTA